MPIIVNGQARAVLFRSPDKPLELVEVPVPSPGEGEILVRVLGCTLCGSDCHTRAGRRKTPTPVILGHEVVGEIVAFGPGGSRSDLNGDPLNAGDRITWSIAASCGKCFYCTGQLPQKCEHLVKYGHNRFDHEQRLLGGLASHCTLLPGTAIVRLPDAIPLEAACPANCATATIAAVIRAAGEISGSHCAVFGLGMLGLTACAMLTDRGAGSVTAIDPAANRRDLATQFGADHLSPPENVAETAGAVNDAQGFDIVLELSGAEAAFHAGWASLRVGGTILLAGSVFPAPPVPVELESIVRKHATLRGVHNYAPEDLRVAVRFLDRNHTRYPFSELVESRFALKDVDAAFAAAAGSAFVRVGVFDRNSDSHHFGAAAQCTAHPSTHDGYG